MIKITIVSVARRPPDWVNTAVAEYGKRLSREFTLDIVDVPAARRSRNSTIGKALQTEAKAILKAVPKGNYTIVLDEKGAAMSSQKFAGEIGRLADSNQVACFIIGGPDGLDPSLKQSANSAWSLSELTLPHTMVRVILLEQIYRAWCILKNHPYHRE